jgi:heme/copper-type cytochrome/quinol oxidase subunit 2
LVEAASVTIELLNYFHDYMIIILLFIITFVTYMFFFVLFCRYRDKYTIDSHSLETI